MYSFIKAINFAGEKAARGWKYVGIFLISRGFALDTVYANFSFPTHSLHKRAGVEHCTRADIKSLILYFKHNGPVHLMDGKDYDDTTD